MKEVAFMNSSPVYFEFSQTSLKALKENDGLELPLERGTNGRLTAGCKEQLIAALQKFLGRKGWQPRARAFCAIGANGVSLRRLTLPASAKEEFQRLLVLQIENEFPLSPEELAWGWHRLGSNGATTKQEVLVAAVKTQPEELAWGWHRLGSNGAATKQEVLVAAVKKEVVEDYANVLLGCGMNPVFTLAALARSSLCPQPIHSGAMLDVGPGHSELTTFDNGVPAAARVLSSSADASVADSAAKALGASWSGKKIFLTGAGDEIAPQLARRLGNGIVCEPLKIESGVGRSAAILGLKKSVEQTGGSPTLILQVKAKQSNGALNLSQPDVKKWAVRAAALLCALLVLPYAEALLLKPFLANKLTRLKAEQGRLATIDRELGFLQFLKQSQPPYLDALFVFAKSAPQGMRIDQLTMNRRGEISLRGSLHDATQVTDFRTKLISSGFLANVAVEEQSPTPDRQKVNVRMSAQWKPAEARAGLAIGPTAAEIEKAKTNKLAQAGGGIPPGGMPPGMMPPMMMPEQMSPPRPARK